MLSPHEERLGAALASLAEYDLPPDGNPAGRWPVPDCVRPAELFGLTPAELEQLIAGPEDPGLAGRPGMTAQRQDLSALDAAGDPTATARPGPAGSESDRRPASPAGSISPDGVSDGCADGGALDSPPPGMGLAGCADGGALDSPPPGMGLAGCADGGALDSPPPGAGLAGFAEDGALYLLLPGMGLAGGMDGSRLDLLPPGMGAAGCADGGAFGPLPPGAGLAGCADGGVLDPLPPGAGLAGFAEDGALDLLPPGVCLAGFADDAHARLDDLDDDALIGVMRGWRRLTSWAQARELAAVAALARRRPADGTPPPSPGEFPGQPSQFISDEVALALTLTSRSADAELDLAVNLACRPATAAALEAGRIDLPRARIVADGLAELSEAHADAVEAAVLPRAPELTTGQLRAALARAILAADPEAARRRREQAEKEARVERWTDPEGTASLSGRNLPPAEVLAADKRLCHIATAWQKQGAVAGMDLLRARAYLALLLGLPVHAPPTDLLPPAHGTGASSADPTGQEDRTGGDFAAPGEPSAGRAAYSAGAGRAAHSAGADLPPLAGSVNLTLPLATLLGWSNGPGEAAGFGPLDGWTARGLAQAAAGHRRARWHLTITGADGQAVAHACTRRRGPDPRAAERWTFTLVTEPIARDGCDHRNEEPGYRPSPRLQHLIDIRSTMCSYPGCRRAAVRCDRDHTVAHDQGGRTCECNLAPLCRRHHRLKQAENWKLEQPSPGVMAWLTPAGRRYITLPSQHPT